MNNNPEEILATGFSWLQDQQFSTALACFFQVLEVDPGNPDASDGACCCLVIQEDYPRATDILWDCWRSGRSTDNNLINLARLLMRKSDNYGAARDLLHHRTLINPPNLEILSIMAELEEVTGNIDAALDLLMRIAVEDEESFEPLAKASLLQIKKGDGDSGMASLLQASMIAPSEIKLRYYHGKASFLLSDYPQALESFLDYIGKADKREWAEDIYTMLGLCYLVTGDLDQSISYLEQALVVNPNDVHALTNAYNAYRSAGDIDKSIECCQRVLCSQLLPGDDLGFKSFSNLMLLYSTLGLPRVEEARITSNQYWTTTLKSQPLSSAHITRTSSRDSRVKIGIISSEIGDHVVSFFLEPLLRRCPKELVDLELILPSCRYENNADRLLSLPEKVLNFSGLNQESCRQAIKDRKYNIIIETTGYTANSSLKLLSKRCAPVQCHYIGYHASTFMPTIDWFVADHSLVPLSAESQFTEKILRIEGPWISRYVPADLPIAQFNGTQNRYVMGSTNQSAKLSKQTLAYWIEALHKIDDSILVIKDRFALSRRVQERLLAVFDKNMIARDRLIFLGGTSSWHEHMSFYNSVDIILDATPWSASTTAFDAIMMGAPFVAIRGSVAASRMSSSILQAANLNEFIADNVSEFGEIVRTHASKKEMHRDNRGQYQMSNLRSRAFDADKVADAVFEALLGIA